MMQSLKTQSEEQSSHMKLKYTKNTYFMGMKTVPELALNSLKFADQKRKLMNYGKIRTAPKVCYLIGMGLEI